MEQQRKQATEALEISADGFVKLLAILFSFPLSLARFWMIVE